MDTQNQIVTRLGEYTIALGNGKFTIGTDSKTVAAWREQAEPHEITYALRDAYIFTKVAKLLKCKPDDAGRRLHQLLGMRAANKPNISSSLPPEVVKEFVNGYDREEYLVAAIKEYLRDDADKAELYRLDLSIEDVLNGRYGAEEEPSIIKMFEKWNAKIGQRVFGG